MAKVIWTEPAVTDLYDIFTHIIYFIRENACYITAVIHGSRDILRYLEPGEWDVTDI